MLGATNTVAVFGYKGTYNPSYVGKSTVGYDAGNTQ
jgi:hypothetical protein